MTNHTLMLTHIVMNINTLACKRNIIRKSIQTFLRIYQMHYKRLNWLIKLKWGWRKNVKTMLSEQGIHILINYLLIH